VSQGDIQTLFGILNENLREGLSKDDEQLTLSGGLMMLILFIMVLIFNDHLIHIIQLKFIMFCIILEMC